MLLGGSLLAATTTRRIPSKRLALGRSLALLSLFTSGTRSIVMSSASSNGNHHNKKMKILDKKDTVHFDPTSIGLPKGWSLTDWSDLKG
jgi:hypothetical protein